MSCPSLLPPLVCCLPAACWEARALTRRRHTAGSENLSGDTAVELLKAGADPAPKNRDGHTPLQLAPDKEVSAESCGEGESQF